MVSIDMEKTGIRLYNLMIAHGTNPKKVSDRMGLSQMSVYKWTYGMTLPRIEHLMELSDMFGIPIEQMIVRKEM